MSRTNSTALALAALVLVRVATAPAFAADLPSRYARPSSDFDAPPPLFTFSGPYVGAVGALGIGRFSRGGDAAFGNAFGGLGGVTVGYNYQSGSLLVGAEADIAFGSISGSGSAAPGVVSTGDIQGIGTLRGRVGYVLDRTLLYVTGGYAGTSARGTLNDFRGAPNLFIDQSHYLSGFAIGAGAEYALTRHISIKGEYLFTGFGSNTFNSGTRDAFNAGANVSLLRAGVNYRF